MDAASLLRLQVEWGADEALDTAPWDRLRPADAPRPALPRPAPAAPGVPAVPAQRLAAGAATLDALCAAMAGFEGCPLRATATSLVFGDGTCAAGVALVGEAPDADSDRTGRAFAGASGRMLDAMLGSVGLGRADIRLLTLVPWRPPGGRAPTETEIKACLPFVHQHLAIVRPRALVLMGALACAWLGGIEGGPRRARGRWHDVALPGLPSPVPALAVASPEHLLAQAAAREATWAEWRRLRRFLDKSQVTEQCK